jgi:hypothetical protein
MIGPKAIFLLLVAGATLGVAALAGHPAAYAADDGLNACGCRQGSTPGMCYCEKKSHCGCPGECEPNGCEERRTKQMEKEIQAETRKAEESARRQRPRESIESSRGGEDDARDRTAAPPETKVSAAAVHKVKVVRMSPGQKRDLAKLIGAYLAEHPDQGGKTIDELRSEVDRGK